MASETNSDRLKHEVPAMLLFLTGLQMLYGVSRSSLVAIEVRPGWSRGADRAPREGGYCSFDRKSPWECRCNAKRERYLRRECAPK